MAQQFRDAGISAEHLDGNTPKKARKAIVERFRAGEVQVLTNVGLFAEGLSVDGVGAVLLLRPTASLALHLQMVGRGLRFQERKICTVIDMVAAYSRFGMLDSKQEWSLDGAPKAHREFDEEGNLTLRQCEYCFKVFPTANVCKFCGAEYELKPREIRAQEEIELKRIQAEQVEAERKRKEKLKEDIRNARSRADFEAIAAENHYNHRWVEIRCKLRGYR